MINTLKVAILLLTLTTSSVMATAVKAESDETDKIEDNSSIVFPRYLENAVIQRLEGRWQMNDDLSARLGSSMVGTQDSEAIIEIKADSTVFSQIPSEWQELFFQRLLTTITMAGTVTVLDETSLAELDVFPFILLPANGYFKVVTFSNSGYPLSGDMMFVPAEDSANDLLLMGNGSTGGDTSFTALDRVIPNPVSTPPLSR